MIGRNLDIARPGNAVIRCDEAGVRGLCKDQIFAEALVRGGKSHGNVGPSWKRGISEREVWQARGQRSLGELTIAREVSTFVAIAFITRHDESRVVADTRDVSLCCEAKQPE